ncbi:MAG: hypothetical protein ACTSXF_12700, partial [Promethearchaeota archaeon]
GKVKESKLKKKTKKSKSSRLIKKKKKSKSSKDKKSHKAEIDVLISTVILPYDERKKMKYWDEGYLFVEIKLFTAPIGDRAKSLRTLLQQNVLSSYFRLRHLFGVIGTSYLSYNAPKKNEPVTWAADEYEENKDKPKWISHLILMDARVLKEYKDAPGRSKAILDAIRVDQQKILKKENINDKKYKYKLIYNFLKVIKMAEIIVNLREELKKERKMTEAERKRIEEIQKKLEAERKRAEAERKRIEEIQKKLEAERKRIEEIQKKLEAERKRAELYKRKLIESGINPDDTK